jgi:tyrosyl-DNA phosphodiesterase 2
MAALLRSAGLGLAAGDFNPVLPEDETLVAENGLLDAWTVTRGSESGFTWGIDGKQMFPPARLDRIAITVLQARSMEVLHPGTIAGSAFQGESEPARRV